MNTWDHFRPSRWPDRSLTYPERHSIEQDWSTMPLFLHGVAWTVAALCTGLEPPYAIPFMLIAWGPFLPGMMLLSWLAGKAIKRHEDRYRDPVEVMLEQWQAKVPARGPKDRHIRRLIVEGLVDSGSTELPWQDTPH